MTASKIYRPRHIAPLALAALLAACGGGGDSAAPEVRAQADNMSLATGQSASLLTNDTIGGQPASVGTGANVALSVTTSPLPAQVSISDGVVAVARGAVPGSYTLNYRLCDVQRADNCSNSAVNLIVPNPPIEAVNDAFEAASGDAVTLNLIANDRLDGVAATTGSLTASALGALPSGFALAANGTFTVQAGAALSAQTLAYRICQTSAPTNCAQAELRLTVRALAALSGRVINAVTSLGAPNVDLVLGNRSVRSGADGSFQLVGVSPGQQQLLRMSSTAFGENARFVDVAANGSSGLVLRVTPVTVAANIDPAAGGTVSNASSSARVVLPAASLVRADGSAAVGQTSVRLTAINPAFDTSLMPGDFTTTVNGANVPIESFGALAVEINDSAGQVLNLRSGQQATIRIPLGTRELNPPASIPLFSFNNTTGRWVQEGTAQLGGTGSNRFYEGTVNHFSVWNADRVMDTVFVSTCVQDASGNRVAGARITADGIDYSGFTSASTDAQGNARIAMRRSSQATLTGVQGTLLSNTVRIGPYAADATLANCLRLAAQGLGLTIKLTWGALPSDLDSYLYLPDGTSIDFDNQGSLSSAPFANLDVDDVSSFGPEVITLTQLMVGTYRYAVNNYSGFSDGPISTSGARVELSLPGQSNVELFTPPSSGETSTTDYWTLFELQVDAQCNVTLRRIPGYTGVEPTTPRAPAVYCSR